MMMAPPQVVGVLLKKPGQHEDPQNHNPRIPPLDPQEIKIRGELYVEDLGEQRMVTIRMGWLWVEGTPMRLPLRALNLRQAAPSLCQPHVSALGFTLSNPQNGTLATFWADTEPIYWSWVRAIAAELVRQTPFRAQRSLNFLEILTICPRGPVPLPDSPTESRRRSRSELRSWFRNASSERQNNGSLTFEESRRRARSELRGWSSNSSDEDVLGEFRTIPDCIIPKDKAARPWAFSESSEGSDDSLPWGGGQSSVDSVDSVTGPTIVIAEPETREQRIQRYKEARRRENEARSRRVVEEDARRRKARAEENNNNVSLAKLTKACYANVNLNKVEQNNNNNNNNTSSNNNNNNNNNNNKHKNHNADLLTSRKVVGVETISHNGASGERSLRKDSTSSNICRISPITKTTGSSLTNDENGTVMDPGERLSLLKKSSLVKVQGNFVRFEEQKNLTNAFNHTVAHTIQQKNDSSSSSANERRSRARERRSVRESRQPMSLAQASTSINTHQVETLRQRKERLASLSSRIPIPQETSSSAGVELLSTSFNSTLNTTPTVPAVGSNYTSFKIREQKLPSYFSLAPEPCEESVARLFERCQRVDHYVPVRDKLTLFESLSRLGGRLARSTEDLGRVKANPSPRGKQRARSLHDLNRASKSVPVREMCRFFEGEKSIDDDNISRVGIIHRGRISSDSITSSATRSRTWSDGNVFPQLTLPPMTLSAKTTPIKIDSSSSSRTKSSSRRRQYAK